MVHSTVVSPICFITCTASRAEVVSNPVVGSSANKIPEVGAVSERGGKFGSATSPTLRAPIDDQNSHQTFIRILKVYYLVAPSENVNYISYAIRSFMKV